MIDQLLIVCWSCDSEIDPGYEHIYNGRVWCSSCYTELGEEMRRYNNMGIEPEEKPETWH